MLKEHASNSSFAVVLLSPDDAAYSAKDSPNNTRFRARQNVIFELGFFTGTLGRERVFALLRETKDFEMLSDYLGVIYTPYDGDSGTWRFRLAKELRACGFDVDSNKLL